MDDVIIIFERFLLEVSCWRHKEDQEHYDLQGKGNHTSKQDRVAVEGVLDVDSEEILHDEVCKVSQQDALEEQKQNKGKDLGIRIPNMRNEESDIERVALYLRLVLSSMKVILYHSFLEQLSKLLRV